MIDRLSHRGPDGRGEWQCPRQQHWVWFGHRRLSILDVSSAGAQPMQSKDNNNVVITFNGEIYNFRELREELSSLGFAFQSGSDTEVLLAAWIAWGSSCVSKLEGIFAFAITNGEHVTLVRDPFGIKPLFFSVVVGSTTRCRPNRHRFVPFFGLRASTKDALCAHPPSVAGPHIDP
jgi:asparagine synthase (glutamine-hydrolysing)